MIVEKLLNQSEFKRKIVPDRFSLNRIYIGHEN